MCFKLILIKPEETPQFTIKKKRKSRRYSAEIMTDADDTDDLTLLANTSAQAESVLQNVDRTSSRKHWARREHK